MTPDHRDESHWSALLKLVAGHKDIRRRIFLFEKALTGADSQQPALWEDH